MRTGFFASLVALSALAIVSRGTGRAEETAASAVPKPAATATTEPLTPPRPPAPDATEPAAHDPLPCCEKKPSVRLWGSSEYLFWWVRKAPLPIPLVTANPDQTTIAALNEPDGVGKCSRHHNPCACGFESCRHLERDQRLVLHNQDQASGQRIRASHGSAPT